MNEAKPRTHKNCAHLSRMLAAIVAFGILFIYWRFHMWKAYNDGYLTDEGWVIGMVWRSPSLFVESYSWKGSFYGTHVSPWMSAASLLSYLWPFGQVSWSSLFFALPQSIVVWCLVAYRKSESFGWFISRLIAGAFVGISGAMSLHATYPHFEVWAIAFGCLALRSYLRGNQAVALVFLVLASGVREDFGIHLSMGIVALALVLGRSEWKRLGAVSAALSAYSIVSSAIRIKIAGPISVETTLFGDPFLSHLSTGFFFDRARGMFLGTAGVLVFVSWVIAFLVSLSTSNRRALAMSAVAIPQIVMSAIAYLPSAGNFELHYGTSVTLSTFLMLMVLFDHKSTSESFTPQVSVILTASFIGLASFVGVTSDTVFSKFNEHIPSRSDQKILDRVIEQAASNGLLIDPALVTIRPNNINLASIGSEKSMEQKCSLINMNASFFGRNISQRAQLSGFGPIDGLPAGIAVTRSGDGCLLPRIVRPQFENKYVFAGWGLFNKVGRNGQFTKIATEKIDDAGLIGRSNPVNLPVGRYQLRIMYTSSITNEQIAASISLYAAAKSGISSGSRVIYGTNGNRSVFETEFEIKESHSRDLRLDILWEGRGLMEIDRTEFVPIAS